MLFVSALLFFLGLAPFSKTGLWIFGLIASSYIVANFAASISLARKNTWSSLLLLALAFAVLHLAYGLGFLVGLVMFWKHWWRDQGRIDNDEVLVRSVKQV